MAQHINFKKGIRGICVLGSSLIAHSTLLLSFRSTIGDVRKCTDEEHITYSGGSKIKDLAQCG